jgi:hypothetical protein
MFAMWVCILSRQMLLTLSKYLLRVDERAARFNHDVFLSAHLRSSPHPIRL